MGIENIKQHHMNFEIIAACARFAQFLFCNFTGFWSLLINAEPYWNENVYYTYVRKFISDTIIYCK